MTETSGKDTTKWVVRDVPLETSQRAVIEAKRRGIPTGKLVAEALSAYLTEGPTTRERLEVLEAQLAQAVAERDGAKAELDEQHALLKAELEAQRDQVRADLAAHRKQIRQETAQLDKRLNRLEAIAERAAKRRQQRQIANAQVRDQF